AMKSCPHRTQESAMWTSSSRSTLMHRDLSITAERESHPGVPPPGGTATAGCDPMSIDPITPGARPDGSVWHSECGEAMSTHRVTDAPWGRAQASVHNVHTSRLVLWFRITPNDGRNADD